MLFRSVVIEVKKGNVTTNLHQHLDQSASPRSSIKFGEHCSFGDFMVIFDKVTLHAFVFRNVIIKFVGLHVQGKSVNKF